MPDVRIAGVSRGTGSWRFSSRVSALRSTARVVLDIAPSWSTSRTTGRPCRNCGGSTVEERVHRFGRHDHVRNYGRDLEDRVRAAGLDFTWVTPRLVMGVRLCWFFGHVPDEAVWIIRHDDANSRDVPAESVRSLRCRSCMDCWNRLSFG